MCAACLIMAVARYARTRLATTASRVFAFTGADMATKTARRPASTPVVTVEEIDEALLHTSLKAERDEHWQRWADALLDQRLRLSRPRPSREIRVVAPDEIR